ncbi:hypothetical protein F6X53_25160 [Methylobacterium soli]|uniref:Uncharacterized protein n=1 Tax=Methylobacterium soli TaxID=553447 RepID=A0A6L3STS0_9HYPH|nr:hypothetical protein F6X53_25160 [Methylobacterium soli]
MTSSKPWPTASRNAARLYERTSTLIRPTTRTTPDVWGAENRVYPPSSGYPGRRNPYLTPYDVGFEPKT